MAERGWVQAARWDEHGSELVTAAAINATVLTVEWVGEFDDEGGELDLNGARLDYVSVDEDADTITLAAPLAVAADAGDRVLVVSGGQIKVDVTLDVTLGEGDAVVVEVPFGDRDLWSEGDYTDPVQVLLSDDLERIEDVPGRTPVRDGRFIDPDTLPEGPQGIPGPPGADGQSLYTWLKYADSPISGMSDDPAGKTHIGLAYNKTTATESSVYADYAWSLVQGAQGNQGVQGSPGADGQPTYTWIKYGTSAAGAGMSDDPTGKSYIGLAYNKTTATESTTPGDYQWALIQGPQGPKGDPGDTGPAGPTGPVSDGVAPSAAPTVTFVGGIGSVFFRWTEVTNADPVTYRLHVRAGSAPTTDGTYEVAAGVGLTTAAVRKLKDGATVVGDGTVTYYGIVTVEDADGGGPASNTASGVPSQVNSPDIAASAITANMLVANDALIDGLKTVDLSAVNFDAVNIDGGSIAIAVNPSGAYLQEFSGTALPAGWTSTKTGGGGSGTASPGVPGASVVSTGPAGQVGSAVLIDTGPAGVADQSAAGFVSTGITATDAEVSLRYCSAVAGDGFRTKVRLMLRHSGTVGASDEDGIYIDLPVATPFVGTSRVSIWSMVNGSSSELGWANIPLPSATGWVRARLRVVAGTISLRMWADGTTEPSAWTVVAQQAGVLVPGTVGVAWHVPSVFTTDGQKVWIDSFDVTTYTAGFIINPDGTGSWPVLESRVTANTDSRVAAIAPTVTMTTGSVGTGAFRTSVDSRVSAVAPTVTMTTGSVGTGAFRDSAVAAVMAAEGVGQIAQTAVAQATGTTNVTLPGLTFTVTSPGTTAAWLVSICADVDIRIASTNIIELMADTVAQGPQIITAGPAGTRVTGVKEWYVTGLAAGSRVFTARTRNTAASTDARINAGHTLMTIRRVL